MMNQKEAVFSAVTSLLGKDFKEGMNCTEFFKARPQLKKELVASLHSSLNNGQWSIESEQKNIDSYIIGLIANYFRKDIRLNGGTPYVPKTTGTRGVSSPTIKSLKQLLAITPEGTDMHSSILADIAKEEEAIRASKRKANIDIEALPEKYRHLVA